MTSSRTDGHGALIPSPRRDEHVPPKVAAAAAWSWRLVAVAAAVAVLAWLLIQLRLVVLPVVGALLLATVLAPVVDRLHAHGWPRALATWTTLGGFVALVAGVVALIGAQVANEFSALGDDLARSVDDIETWARGEPLNLSQDQIDRIGRQARDAFGGEHGALAGRLVEGARLVVEAVAGALLALVVAFFVLKDGDRIGVALVRLAPVRHRAQVRAAGAASRRALGAYLRGVAVTGIVDSVLIGVGLVAVGVPLVVPLMILTFAGAFLPLVGAFAAGVVAVLVALASGGVTDALMVAAIVVVVQQIEGDLLAPLVVGRSVRLHPLVVVLALTTGAVVAGIAGAVLAVPVVAVAAAATRAVRAEPLAMTT
jgi:predicted PurR-regulated permease PerM